MNLIDIPDYLYLEEALKVAEKFLNCVNENVRIKENQDRLDWLQQCVQNDLNLVFNSNTNKLGPRQLLHHSVLKKLKTNKELIGFLFNDFLLLVQPSKSVGTQFTFQRNTNITFKMYKQVNSKLLFMLALEISNLRNMFFLILLHKLSLSKLSSMTKRSSFCFSYCCN